MTHAHLAILCAGVAFVALSGYGFGLMRRERLHRGDDDA